jgi:regulatory protein
MYNYSSSGGMKLNAVSHKEVRGNLRPRPDRQKAPKATELKITKISQQIKKIDRYSIYVNDKYSFSLNEYQLSTAGIYIGKVISAGELENFATESQFGKIYERAIGFVLMRPHSSKEIHDYLVRILFYPRPKSYVDKSGQRQYIKQIVDKVHAQQILERVINRLDEKGHINDESFAGSWVASRSLNKKSSIRKMRQELLARGVSDQIIATVLQNNNSKESDNLKFIISKKRRQQKYLDETKLKQYLLRQGFSYDDIKESLNSMDSE